MPFLALCSHLPLWLACASLAVDAFQGSGASTEMGPALYRLFQQAGLPAPTMRLEMSLGNDPDFTRWIHDVLCSLRPQIERLNLPLEKLGDFDTLPARLHAEAVSSNIAAPCVGLVGAWSRKPAN